jgi:aspartyl aminopeptidase
VDNPRKLALLSLIKSDTQECYTNIEINTVLSRSNMEKSDAALYTLLYLGVIEKKLFFDNIISQYSKTKLVELDEYFVIPSVAIHFNRTANDGIKLNPQIDMQVLSALGEEKKLTEAAEKKAGGKIIDYDLYVVCAQPAFKVGFDGRLACSPRVDNLTSAFASVRALIDCDVNAIPVIFLADNEEVGSRTKQGAGSTFLKDVLTRINTALGKSAEELSLALASSFMLSCDNAHATHPNHPELSDTTNKVTLGGGIVIKHHANQNYTTDAMSSAIAKSIFTSAGAKWQDFFMRSDLPCGGTLGAISSSQLSIRSVDVGIPQLAMHSTAETFALEDYDTYVAGIKAVLSSYICLSSYDTATIK